MAKEKTLSPNDLYSVIEVTGKVVKVEELQDFKNGLEQHAIKLRIKWVSSEIFIWEKELSMIKKMNKVKEGDVVFVKGLFHCRWHPKMKNVYPTIEKVLGFEKLGVFKK